MGSIGSVKANAEGSYTVVAQRAGRVVEANVGPGDTINGMDPAVIIDTSDELWVEAQLPASLIGKVRPGDSIRLGDSTTGKVLSVGHTLDPKTRSAKLIGSIPASSKYVTGQMVTLSIHREAAAGGFDVPAQSVVWVAGTPSVFVPTAAGFAVPPVAPKGKTLHGAPAPGNPAPALFELVAIARRRSRRRNPRPPTPALPTLDCRAPFGPAPVRM